MNNPSSRPRRMMSIERFASIMKKHVFCFVFLKKVTETMSPQEFFVRVKNDRALLETAWDGGDVYMSLVQARYQELLEQIQEHAEHVPSEEEKAFEAMLDCMSEEEKNFFYKLRGHDWYYSYSDDNKVWNAGNACEKQLKETVRTGKPLFGLLFNLMCPK